MSLGLRACGISVPPNLDYIYNNTMHCSNVTGYGYWECRRAAEPVIAEEDGIEDKPS